MALCSVGEGTVSISRPLMLEIFKAGEHTDNRGVKRLFTEEMVQEIVDSYDFKKHRAPILTGHNENQPNKGLIADLKKIGDKLFAIPRNVLPEFKESVNREEWAGLSPRLYHPNDPSNPAPGKWGLRHLAFLQIPAVKGMALPEFSEHPDWDVEFCFNEISFSGWLDSAIASVFRNLREWLIEKEGLELADRLIPVFVIEQLLVEPVYEQMRENEPKPLNYSEGGAMTEEELNKRLAEVEKREEAIALRERNTQLTAEYSEWIEPLIAGGKVLPAEKSRHIATLIALSGDAKVEFGEGSDAQSLSLVDCYKRALLDRAKIVEYSEQAKAGESVPAIEFNAPDGITVANQEQYAMAKAYQKKHPELDLVECYKAVGGK